MKAVVLHKTGKSNVLKVSDVEVPEIRDDEVLVKVAYSGINYADLLSRQGLYSWAPSKPYILGLEAGGLVDKIGKDVENVKIGDQVSVAAQQGGYAEFIKVKSFQALPTPSYFNLKEAAAFLATYGTSYLALVDMARIRTGENLLVHSAAGGVGTAAIHLSKPLGLNVWGTSSTKAKRDFIRDLGAIPLSYGDFDLKLSLNPPNCILETVGGDVYKRSFKLLGPMGRIVLIGASGIKLNKRNPFSWYKAWKSLPKTSIRKVLRFSKAFMGLHAGYLMKSLELVEPSIMDLIKIMEEHEIHPVIREDQIYPLSEVSKAHDLIENRKNIGKVLLDPSR